MTSIIATIATTVPFVAPSGTEFGAFRISISSGGSTISQDVAGLSATFDNVPEGTWTGTAVRVDVDGLPIGPTLTGPSVDVPPAGATGDIPATMTVELAVPPAVAAKRRR